MAQTDGVGSPVFWDAYARVRVQTRGDLINGAIRQAAECRRVLRLPVDSPIAVFPPDWMRSCLSARDIEWLWREHAIEVKRLEDRFSDARLYTSPMIGFGRPAPIGAPPG